MYCLHQPTLMVWKNAVCWLEYVQLFHNLYCTLTVVKRVHSCFYDWFEVLACLQPVQIRVNIWLKDLHATICTNFQFDIQWLNCLSQAVHWMFLFLMAYGKLYVIRLYTRKHLRIPLGKIHFKSKVNFTMSSISWISIAEIKIMLFLLVCITCWQPSDV